MTEERPTAAGAEPPAPEERTPRWPRRAAKVAADAAWQDLNTTGRLLVDTSKWKLRAAWSRRPPRAALTAWAFLAVAGLAGASSLLAQAALARRLPTGLDWRAAATLLDRDSRPGDAVVVAPAVGRARARRAAGAPAGPGARPLPWRAARRRQARLAPLPRGRAARGTTGSPATSRRGRRPAAARTGSAPSTSPATTSPSPRGRSPSSPTGSTGRR